VLVNKEADRTRSLSPLDLNTMNLGEMPREKMYTLKYPTI